MIQTLNNNLKRKLNSRRRWWRWRQLRRRGKLPKPSYLRLSLRSDHHPRLPSSQYHIQRFQSPITPQSKKRTYISLSLLLNFSHHQTPTPFSPFSSSLCMRLRFSLIEFSTTKKVKELCFVLVRFDNSFGLC